MAILLDHEGHHVDQTWPLEGHHYDVEPQLFTPALELTMVSFDNFNVYYSPLGGGQAALKALIDAAATSIDVLAYQFTDVILAAAIVAAKIRGVTVRVVLDAGESNVIASDRWMLFHNGVDVWLDSHHRIMHNKVMIIDGEWVTTGSYNFTPAAQMRNAENLITMKPDPAVVASYQADFDLHLGHATAYSP